MGFLSLLGEAALGGGCFMAAEEAEYLGDALLVDVAPVRAGQDDAAGVTGEQRGAGEDDEAAEAAAEDDWLVQP